MFFKLLKKLKVVLIVVALLSCAVPTHAATIIAHTIKGSANGTSVTTDAINITGADLVMIAVTNFSSSNLATDSVGNVLVARTYHNPFGRVLQVYYCYNPTTSASYTVSFSDSGSAPSVAVVAISGSIASPYDTENTASGVDVNSILSGSVTPSTANNFIFLPVQNENGVTTTFDSGFTPLDEVTFLASTHFGLATAYLNQSAATTQNATASFSGTVHVTITAPTVFKVSGGSPPASSCGRLALFGAGC